MRPWRLTRPRNSATRRSPRQLQRQTYTDGDFLRRLLLTAGSVVAETDEIALAGCAPGLILPKRPFTDLSTSTLIDLPAPGKALIFDQLQATYAAIAEHAEPLVAPGEHAEMAAEAIASLREAGAQPDVVLLPGDVMVRAMLARHSEWEWKNSFMRDSFQIASLCGVAVYAPGPIYATALIVCRLGSAIRKVERRRPGGHPFGSRSMSSTPRALASSWSSVSRPGRSGTISSSASLCSPSLTSRSTSAWTCAGKQRVAARHCASAATPWRTAAP